MEEKRRRGRPRMDENKKKRNVHIIRITDDEADTLRGLSDDLGVSCAQVFRNALAEYSHQKRG